MMDDMATTIIVLHTERERRERERERERVDSSSVLAFATPEQFPRLL
jgi:hypothetical protein